MKHNIGRIPLPKKAEMIHRSTKDYDRRKEKGVYIEWEIDCEKCGVFTQEQKSEPVLCPQCGSSDIETTPIG